MEPEIVTISSAVGSLISIFLLIHSTRDRWLVKAEGKDELVPVAQRRWWDDLIRFILQVFFLIPGGIVLLGMEGNFREYSIWLLVLVPVILAGWGIRDLIWRRSQTKAKGQHRSQ